ncbi:hypothetical protein [Lichenifustis flavocetrariae]|uniref:VPLPA-CTERM sorting domain-containing protein n=1 Tax=Lichenifustis flavocetrariae TaxID=2949735 RepID=A0AA41YY10_9HYPH|nr:hypothetical protein [Lichenifustis flavocetrariae]MCW6506983.1 hypothetical protein [Lichenifustis flavocetrariae]
MKSSLWAGLAVATAVMIPSISQAQTLNLSFSGPGVAAALTLTVSPDLNTGPLGTSPNQYDPVGSYTINSVSGTFSDTNNGLGITNATITGFAKLNQVDPEHGNLLAPARFSLFTVANGVDDGSGHPSPGLHYDNLFYPSGSPQTATDYPFHGGAFDIYGLVFTIAGGDAVNLWSNGNTPGGLNYGVAVTDGTDVLDYTSGVSAVPLPSSAPMFGAALFGLAGFSYAAKRKKAAAAA